MYLQLSDLLSRYSHQSRQQVICSFLDLPTVPAMAHKTQPSEMSSSLSIDDRVKALLIMRSDVGGLECFDSAPLREVQFVSASSKSQSTHFSFTVCQSLCNKNGNLHGGATATLFDSLTTTALFTFTKEGSWDIPTVSRTLTVTYLRPMPAGMKVLVDCEVMAAGKNLANIRGTMKSEDGKICATCVHDKALIRLPKL